MYLSKGDFDFLKHFHDDVFNKKITVTFDGITTRSVPLAVFIEVEDYVHFLDMLARLSENREQTNRKCKEKVAKMRLVDKNYGRSKK